MACIFCCESAIWLSDSFLDKFTGIWGNHWPVLPFRGQPMIYFLRYEELAICVEVHRCGSMASSDVVSRMLQRDLILPTVAASHAGDYKP